MPAGSPAMPAMNDMHCRAIPWNACKGKADGAACNICAPGMAGCTEPTDMAYVCMKDPFMAPAMPGITMEAMCMPKPPEPCAAAKPWQCGDDNRCVATEAECGGMAQCPVATPIRCHTDNTCAVAVADCPKDCWQTEMEKKGFKNEGMCGDGTTPCTGGGWTTAGTQCIGCTAVTDAQMQTVGDVCMAATTAATTATVDAATGCWDREFLAKKYKYEGTCQGDGTEAALKGKVCMMGGVVMSDPGSTCKCNGLVTQAQENDIRKICDKEAKIEWDKTSSTTGGGEDERLKQMAESSMTSAVGNMVTCFEKARKAKGLKMEGKCTVRGKEQKCWPGGWNEEGTQCTETCDAMTDAQMQNLHQGCEGGVKKDMARTGSKAALAPVGMMADGVAATSPGMTEAPIMFDGAYDAIMAQGAAATAFTGATSCFDTEFTAKAYKWEGTCSDTKEACLALTYTCMGKGATCTGALTKAQNNDIRKKCDSESRKDIIMGGGSLAGGFNLGEGAAVGAVAGMATCFDKEMTKRKFGRQGVCPATKEPCTEGGWTAMNTQCTGCTAATEDQVQEVNEACSKDGRKDFMRGGGKPEEWEVMQETAATKATTMAVTTCFDKAFAANKYVAPYDIYIIFSVAKYFTLINEKLHTEA